MDERQFIRQVESADAKELARILRNVSAEQADALKVYFGEEGFQHLRQLALSASSRSGSTKGKVVVLHGILGGELTFYQGVRSTAVWVNIPQLILGKFCSLTLGNEDPGNRVEATGILKRYYGEQILRLLQQGWDVHPFWYDWRLDIDTVAIQLRSKLREWLHDRDETVHIVAHSMGGLVTRSFIRQFPQEWPSGKLVMLGTPNNGSFNVPQMLSGWNSVLRMIDLLDLGHKGPALLKVICSFPSAFQMLPNPALLDYELDRGVWKAEQYAQRPATKFFERAKAFWNDNSPVVDPDRMIYIAGANRPTAFAVKDLSKLGVADGYQFSMAGDGTVPHRLGLLSTFDGHQIPTFYVDEEHGALPNNRFVGEAVDQLLEGNGHGQLRSEPGVRPLTMRGPEQIQAEALVREDDLKWEANAALVATQLQSRTVLTEEDASFQPLRVPERQAENLLLADFLATGHEEEDKTGEATAQQEASASLSIDVAVRHWGVHLTDFLRDVPQEETYWPVDSISVGHYIGIMPSASEGALSAAISVDCPTLERSLLSELTRRGAIHGGLNEVYTLTDPRNNHRAILLAGMGYPGQFGQVELRSCIRQLFWVASRLGKKHLATVLIGSEQGNVSPEDAVAAWVSAIQDLLKDGTLSPKNAAPCVVADYVPAGAAPAPAPDRLQRITICEFSASRFSTLRDTFQKAIAPLGGKIRLLDRLPEEQPQQLEALVREEEEQNRKRSSGSQAQQAQSSLTAIYDKDNGRYLFTAMTTAASVPEREIKLDRALVDESNNSFPGLDTPADQQAQGRFVRKLLLPEDFNAIFRRPDPVVVVCDNCMAGLHWEMISMPLHVQEDLSDDNATSFLGIDRGLTRQLKTGFASLSRRQHLTAGPAVGEGVLKILIIIDPSNTLPAAEKEGEAVAKLFSQLKNDLDAGNLQSQSNRVRKLNIVVLSGPSEASRQRVLRELMSKSYDVLHYCGHCVYDKLDVTKSGWIFAEGSRITANELRRIGQAPAFIFSNACESGITPDRSQLRNAALPATFAESFFAQGVQNFICTAWPVNDDAALTFAKQFYESWIDTSNGVLRSRYIHQAMREARKAVFDMADGATGMRTGMGTWGAYQHYGDPYATLF